MRNLYKSLLPVLAFVLMLCTQGYSQTTHQIGNGTVSNGYLDWPTPFGDWNEGTRMQYLYRASDLTAAGMQAGRITAIKFNVVNLNTSSGLHENYTLYIKNTTTTTLSTTGWETGATQVWGPTNYQPVLGINTFTLSTPFLWDGTSNILVEICHGDPAALTSTTWTRNSSVNYTTVSYNAQRTYAADAIATGCGATSTSQSGTATNRPNIIFDIISCSEITGLNVTNLKKFTATIGWNAATGTIDGYEYVLDQYPSDPTTAGTLITTNSYNASGLTAGTTYYFHVRTKCSSTSYSTWKTFSFTTPICSPVDNLTISNVTSTSAQLDWTKLTVAEAYEYIVTTEGALPQPPYINTTSNTAALTNLAPSTLYNVFIRSLCAGNDSSLWRQYTFTTFSQCMPPYLTATEVAKNEWNIRWESDPTVVAYEYALAGLTTPTIGTSVYTDNVTLSIPDDGAPYYVYARCKCNNIYNVSPWASVMLRDGTGLSVSNVTKTSLELYPNPTHDKVQIKWNGVAGKNARIQLLDASGRVILENVFTGTALINMAKEPAGLYFIKYQDENQSMIQKITKF
jgi:hypothetical protein